jgi:uncharacterized membrane protein
MNPEVGGASPVPVARVDSLDVIRGLIMIAMALDHTRSFLTGLTFNPENLEQTWMALFLTRWVTHFCAPLFFFLAGTGAYFYGLKHGRPDVQRFLWTRGLWLIVLEFTLVAFAWTFVWPWGFFGVIWALGCSMVLLAPLVRLPVKALAAISIAVIVLHNLLDPLRPEQLGAWGWVWNILHVKGPIEAFGVRSFVLFPLVPLFAVMAAGYAFGALMVRGDRKKWLTILGLACIAAFVLLRVSNLYGNPPALPGGVTPGDFHLQTTFEKSLILFLDTEKYPPSLQFLLMTIGPAFLFIAWLEGKPLSRLWQPVLVFGRVPMFFYLLHLYVIHVLAIVIALVAAQPYDWLLKGGFWFHQTPAGYGHDLPFIYLMTVVVLVILYFPCRWYMEIKRRGDRPWLSYL